MHKRLVLLMLAAMAMRPSVVAGDHDCIIGFIAYKVHGDGSMTALTAAFGEPGVTVSLALGERVRFFRFGPGISVCGDSEVGLEVRVGEGPDYATASDPIQDTLPLRMNTGTDLTAPGHYYVHGIPVNALLLHFSWHMRLTIEDVVTAVPEDAHVAFRAWPTPEALALEHAPKGDLYLFDISGKPVFRTRIMANEGIQSIALPHLPSGGYLVTIATGEAIVRRRIVLM